MRVSRRPGIRGQSAQETRPVHHGRWFYRPASTRCARCFELMGKNITLVGGNGDGQTAKVANQIIVALNIRSRRRGLLFAAKAGADPAKVREPLMGGFASSKILEVHGERMIRRTFDPGFESSCIRRDLNLALANARELRGVAEHGDRTAALQRLCTRTAAAGITRRWCALEMLRQLRGRLNRYGDATADGVAKDVRCRSGIGPGQGLYPTVSPDCTQGQGGGDRCGQGLGSDGACRRAALGRALEGLVVTRYGYQVDCDSIEIVQAAHPVPDQAGLQAAQRMLDRVGGLNADDLVDLPDIRRRIGAAATAASGAVAGRQTGGQSRPAEMRRIDIGDELRTPSPVRDQGRAPGRCLPSRAMSSTC